MTKHNVFLVSRVTRKPFTEVQVSRGNFDPGMVLGEAVVMARRMLIDIRGAFLNGANLAGQDLSDMDLSNCDLSGVNFEEADLSRANLTGAVKTGINLKGTIFSGTIWSDGITISRTPILITGLPFEVQILDEHMNCGCELHCLAEWAAFDDRRVAEMSSVKGLRAWKAHKDALLALARAEGRVF